MIVILLGEIEREKIHKQKFSDKIRVSAYE